MRGAVIGKFYPPHAGHLGLIEFAAARCAELHVLVCHSARYSIPGTLRVEWIRRLVPAGVRVHLVEEKHADDDSEGWAARTREVLGFAPERVFTSEEYGPRWASFLGAEHVFFGRSKLPISGTEVRKDPHACWAYLPAPVRGHYARRVAVVGAESTGKTTLCKALASRLGATWVPEFGREYWEKHRPACWREEDFLTIAAGQNAREDAAAEACSGLLICDTTARCTGTWAWRYLGARSARVDALGTRSYALTLFCEPDFPWVQDGTRDGEKVREDFSRELRRGLECVSLSGALEQRAERAVSLITTPP